jgi:CHASE2 domain-containing sensor protein
VNFPPRVALALVVIAAFTAIAVWGVVALLRAQRLTGPQQMVRIGAIVLITALLIGWMIFLWPAYWD